MTTRLDTSAIDANGEQAGLVIWKSENPNTFSKLVAIQANSGNHQFEHIVTQNGGVNPPIPQSITPAPGGQLPDHVLLRARYDGTKVIGEFSPDDGESWTLIGQEGHAAPLAGSAARRPRRLPRRRPAAAPPRSTGSASTPAPRPGGPVDCAGSGSCNPLSDQFDGTELDSKWELVNPHATSQPGVEDDHLTLPLVPGDLFGGNGNAQMLLQQAPADSWVATAKIAHANVDTNGEAAGLALINSFNPNHFVKTAVQYKSDTDPDTPGDQPGKWAERVVTSDGNAVVIPPATVPWPNSGALNLTGDYVWVRFVHDAAAGEITTWTSTNGTSFTSFGPPIDVDAVPRPARRLQDRPVRQARRLRRRRGRRRRVQRRGRHGGPADAGRRLRRRRPVPAERRVRGHGARRQVGGRQPGTRRASPSAAAT